MYNTVSIVWPTRTIKQYAPVLLCVAFWAATAFGQKSPQTIVLNGEKLNSNLHALSGNSEPVLTAALRDITVIADKLVKAGKLFSVMNKEQVPPSGNKHDYMSQAPYWWPDPAKPTGLPYIRRDGDRNPELNKISDSAEMGNVIADAETLAVAYYFTGDERYAKQGAAVIRTWFLDAKKRQNPNLNFAQGIPGINKGRGIGLIETRELYRVIDAAILIQGSKSWTASDHAGLRSWFSDFLTWMTESSLGKDEADEKNNHGTYYDVQVIAYSLFVGKPDIARKQIEITKQRIGSQIEPDGSQPHELARTLSWGYTNMNLRGFFTIARLAENAGVDLWNYKTSDGRGIKKAVEWLVPYAKNEKKWTHEQIKPRKFDQTAEILSIASRKFKQTDYESLAKSLEAVPDVIERLTS